jgi:hypothetical protein
MTMGCASDRYQYGTSSRTASLKPLGSEATNPVFIGGEHPFVDRLELVVQAPRRFGRRVVGRKTPSPAEATEFRKEAVELSQNYLAANGMDDVHIDVRRYEPGQQWKRIRKNDRISPLWKYTGGTLSWLRYTLIPGRAMQSDAYDVYANTISINSASPTSALYQAARAKEFQQHRFRGTYAMLQRAPLVPFYHNTRATSDVLSYAKAADQSDELLKQLYPTAYSRLASAGVSEALFFSPLPTDTPFVVEPAIRIVGGIIGRTAGRIAMRQELSSEPKPEPGFASDPKLILAGHEEP